MGFLYYDSNADAAPFCLPRQSEPYDPSALRVPKYSPALLDKLLDSSSQVTPGELPDKESVTTAKGKARSWERVRRVLEGERKKIEERRIAAT